LGHWPHDPRTTAALGMGSQNHRSVGRRFTWCLPGHERVFTAKPEIYARLFGRMAGPGNCARAACTNHVASRTKVSDTPAM